MGNGFLTFDMYKFGKIRRHHWKQRLEISLKVMRLKRAKVKLRKATKSYRSMCGGGVGGGRGQVCAATLRATNVREISRL